MPQCDRAPKIGGRKTNMKTIIHLSDLHFGKVDEKRVEPLLSLIEKIDPDIVIVSGDFTQRAKEKEFIEAQNFLKRIKRPIFVLPGNHDIPLYNVFRRFFFPFKKYLQFISEDLAPSYSDDDIAIIGINSVRRFTISSGRISDKQLEKAGEYLKEIKGGATRIVVCHHPFDLPFQKETHHNHTHKVVAGSKSAMRELSKYKVDIFLSGHLHLQHIGDTTLRYKIKGYSALIIQAGTAISKRRRGEPVSFNVLKLDKQAVTVETYSGNSNEPGFDLQSTETYVRTEEGWKKPTREGLAD